MRKRLIPPIPHDVPHPDKGWLDLGRVAVAEVTSEEKEYPVEAALVAGEMWGWRAAGPGLQTIRLLFDQPQELRRNLARFRRNRDTAYPRIWLAMVCGWRTLVSRNCASAVEFQPT